MYYWQFRLWVPLVYGQMRRDDGTAQFRIDAKLRYSENKLFSKAYSFFLMWYQMDTVL